MGRGGASVPIPTCRAGIGMTPSPGPSPEGGGGEGADRRPGVGVVASDFGYLGRDEGSSGVFGGYGCGGEGGTCCGGLVLPDGAGNPVGGQ